MKFKIHYFYDTPLHLAIRGKFNKIVELLLLCPNIDVNEPSI